MTLGIVIVTFQCRGLVLECLASIARMLPDVLPNTVIVDNHSHDGTLTAVAERFPTVRCLAKERNVGFAAAANAGMRELAEADAICLLNPDTTLLDAGLLDAATYLEEHPEVGILGARVENEDGSLQASCRAFPGHLTALFNRHSLPTKLLPGNRWSSEYLMSSWPHDEIRDVDWVSGACMLIHRRVIDRIGLLDAGYFFSIEDVDYCRTAHDTGFAVRYFPMARVRHRVGGSSRHAVYRAMTAHHMGMWRYYKQHMRSNLIVDVITAGGIGARLAIHALSYTSRTVFNRLRGAPNP